MQSSPYLAQALQQMQADPAISAPDIDVQALAQAAKKRKAFEAENPGQSYAKHQMGAMASNLRAAPGNVMGAIKGVPGQLAGLFSLGGR